MYKIKLSPGDETDETAEGEGEGEESKLSDRISTIELPGHRHDIRAAILNSNDEMLLTVSNCTLNRLFSIKPTIHLQKVFFFFFSST